MIDKSKNMDVCYIINRLAPGGAPTLLLNIVRKNDNSNINFTIVYLEENDVLADNFRDAGAQVVDIDSKFKFDPRMVYQLCNFLHKSSFDIIHTHLPYSQTVGRVGSVFSDNKGTVSTQHTFSDRYHPITRFTERITRPIDDATIAVSNAVRSSFSEPEVDSRWSTIYNGVDVNSIVNNIEGTDVHSFRNNHNIPENADVVLNVGRYIDVKKQEDIIKAMSNLNTDDLYLILVGWGPCEEDLRTKASELGVVDRVRITGRKTDVAPYYAISDMFVSASSVESFGIAVVEAMAAELPIIATDVPGVREVLEYSEQGIIRIPPNSPSELADAIEQVRGRPPLTNYDRALSEFSINKTINDYTTLYRNVLPDDSV